MKPHFSGSLLSSSNRVVRGDFDANHSAMPCARRYEVPGWVVVTTSVTCRSQKSMQTPSKPTS
jgi:hypothetical protein